MIFVLGGGIRKPTQFQGEESLIVILVCGCFGINLKVETQQNTVRPLTLP